MRRRQCLLPMARLQHTTARAWLRPRARDAPRPSSSWASTLYAQPSPAPQLAHATRGAVADHTQGTTFSGIAFAFATNTEAKEDIITEWPGAGNQTKQKVSLREPRPPVPRR